MRILLDECLPVDFRHALAGHEVHTTHWAGLRNKKNGELLLAAEAAGYGVLITEAFPTNGPACEHWRS